MGRTHTRPTKRRRGAFEVDGEMTTHRLSHRQSVSSTRSRGRAAVANDNTYPGPDCAVVMTPTSDELDAGVDAYTAYERRTNRSRRSLAARRRDEPRRRRARDSARCGRRHRCEHTRIHRDSSGDYSLDISREMLSDRVHCPTARRDHLPLGDQRRRGGVYRFAL